MKTYQFEPYYRVLCRELILKRMKMANRESLLNASSYVEELLQMGYEMSDTEITLITRWLEDLLDLKFVSEILKEIYEEHPRCQIEEVIIHNESWVQVIGRERLEFYGPFLEKQDFQLALEVFSLKEGQLWNRSRPFQSFQASFAEKRWRAGLMHHSLSPQNSSKIFLRSQKEKDFPMESFHLTEGQISLLKKCLDQKKNLLIVGATGSGKTTFLRALTQHIPEREHLITLEDTNELNPKSPFATQLVSCPEEGKTLVDYCHYALRMRPDRLILGEIRSDEVVPFLLSINTGHGGMMASLHANSAIDAIHRLCLLFQIYSSKTAVSYPDVLKLVCQGVDFIVHLQEKRVTNILEIKGSEGTTPYYELWN